MGKPRNLSHTSSFVQEPASLRRLLEHERPLLLQGPMGPFFDRLARSLLTQGLQVRKVHFNGGDEFFYSASPAQSFRGTLKEWAPWLRRYIAEHQVDALVIFGQTRPLHLRARAVARELGLPVYIFEEGYFRPDYVTLECNGVNADSALPRDPAFYRQQPLSDPPPPRPTRQRFRKMSWQAVAYSLALLVRRPWYRHYRHHRSLNPLTEGLRWVRSGWRKLKFDLTERHLADWLYRPENAGRWFLVPLQVHNDSQVTHHSPFSSVEAFIDQVMTSFAAHARRNDLLVIKHHPMDRGHRDYGQHIARQMQALGLQRRVIYLHDAHLPTLLRHARGVVTINSTVGLQALYHRCPVLTLGESFYALPGLVHRGPMDLFWTQPGKVDPALFRRFRTHVIAETHLNASFYGDVPGLLLPPETTSAPEQVHERGPQPLGEI